MKKMLSFGVFTAISLMGNFFVASVLFADEGVIPALPAQCVGTIDDYNLVDISLGQTASGSNDFIFAGDGNNVVINGGGGSDCILVGNGNMADISGNGNSDTIIVGNFNSGNIRGKGGNDTIVVGENNIGNISGEGGNDTLVDGYGSTGIINGGGGIDIIVHIPPAPSADPLPGTFNSIQEITLLSDGATSIFYTTDGTTPDCQEENGELYESPFPVLSTTTITAIACTDEGYASPVASLVYTIVDTTAPTVTKLGDNLADVILNTGDTHLTFSEVLSDNSKISVENALTAGANKALTYYWDANDLMITAAEETAFANDVMINVSDVVGNSAELLLVDSVLESTQKSPDSEGAATIDSTTPQVVITNPTQAVDITIESGAIDPTIDVGSFITGGTGTLPEINITSANANNANVVIPASTVVTSADIAWDGVIAAPTVTTVTLPATEGETKTLSTAIEIGFTGAKLSFNKAVRILLPGQAGKKAGYVRTGTVFTEITNTCVADNQATGDALAADGDCKIDVGGDLVIWTKHFTTFATYTQTSTPAPAPSSGGGGGTIWFPQLYNPDPGSNEIKTAESSKEKIVIESKINSVSTIPTVIITPSITPAPNPKIIPKIAKVSALTPTVTPSVSRQTLQKATILENISHAVVLRVEKIGTWLFELFGIKSK